MRKTRRTGARLPVCAAAAVLLLLIPAAVAGSGQKKGEAPYALIAGTVFRSNGMSLPGAEVTIEPASNPPKEGRKFKKKKYSADSRGEFAIRVPAVAAEYRLVFSAPGFATQEKSVAVAGEDRIDVFVRLEPASK